MVLAVMFCLPGGGVGVPEGECHQALKMVSLTSPVERLLSCRLGMTLLDSAVGSPNPLSGIVLSFCGRVATPPASRR
jgi:hypothetical protein